MITKQVLTGVLVGIIATAVGFYLYVELALEGTFTEALQVVKQKKLLGMVLSIAAIPNLFAFFAFVKQKQDYKARGVLIATFIVAFIILITQFL